MPGRAADSGPNGASVRRLAAGGRVGIVRRGDGGTPAAGETADRTGLGAMKDGDWLARFHEGDSSVLAAVYTEHFELVARSVRRAMPGRCAADQETVVFRVFERLIENRRARASFRGGSLARWLTTIARNAAVDFLRRHARERPVGPGELRGLADHPPWWPPNADARLLARDRFRWLEKFYDDLPVELQPLFLARFVRGLTQREAAAKLGIPRSTLATWDGRIRARLRRQILRLEGDER